jgi:outer membrane protein
MKSLIAAVLAAAMLLPAQQTPASLPILKTSVFKVPEVAPVRLANSARWDTLYRDGKIYLSLRDAIALGLENNLDLEIVRYAPQIAATDELRAKAGGALRGVPLTVREGPQGLGAPAVTAGGTLGGGDAPALSSLGNPGVQTDLSILGSLPLSTGTVVPSFDPVVYGLLNWGHRSEPQNNAFLPPGLLSVNSRVGEGQVGLQQGFGTGGAIDVNFNSQNVRNNNPLLNYNPYNTASLGVTITQPLLRGFGPAVNHRYIRIARNNGQIADYVFQQQVIATVSSIVRLYWDLASLNQDVAVRREAVASAEQLLADNQNQVQAGTAAPIDVTRARAELARRKRDVAVAESLVRQQEAVFKDYLVRSSLAGAAASAPIVTTDTIQIPDREEVTSPADDLIQKAFQSRPDVAQAKLQVTNSEISLKGSRSALLPALDIVASARNNGFSGDVSSIVGAPGTLLGSPRIGDPLLTGGYGGAAGQLFKRNFPDYALGARLSIPLRNRSARADVVRDELSVRQQEIRLQQLHKQVRLEVTNALIALEQARATWEATKQERLLGEETLEAEREKVQVGASTAFFVIQYQRDLAAAKSAEVSARASYVKARTALQRALGTTLADYGVQLEDVRQGVVAQR